MNEALTDTVVYMTKVLNIGKPFVTNPHNTPT